MNGRMKFKISVDVVMIVLLFLLMAYHLIRGAVHEWDGVLFIVLIAVHQILNRQWWKGLFRGRYTKFRVLQVFCTVGLLAAVVGLAWSGFIMSRHVFSFVPQPRGSRVTAQIVYLSMAYWAFVFAGLHLGFNWNVMQGMMRRFMKPSHNRDEIVQTAVVAVSVYGVYVLYDRHVWEYLFMQTHFVMYGARENPLVFFADFLSFFVLFTAVGFCLSRWRALK